MPTVPTPSRPPVAPQQPYEHVEHGVRRPDPFQWMRRLDAPVLAHLSAERGWYDVATEHLGPLVGTLRAEMTGRVPATDSSVSWPQHGYSYYTVTPAGREYDQLLRRSNGEPELLLDVNGLVGDSGYVDLGLWEVSPNTSLMAWSVDFDGDEVYELRFRDLADRCGPRRRGAAHRSGRRLVRGLGVLLLPRARRPVAPAPGLAAPDRDAGRRGRAGAGGPRRPVRAGARDISDR